jgi:hypothetical protein
MGPSAMAASAASSPVTSQRDVAWQNRIHPAISRAASPIPKRSRMGEVRILLARDIGKLRFRARTYWPFEGHTQGLEIA